MREGCCYRLATGCYWVEEGRSCVAATVAGDSKSCSKRMPSTWLGSGHSRIAMQEDGGARCALPRIVSADNHPLLRRRGGRGGWETESLGCGIGKAVQAINIDPARQNRCGACVLLCELMAPSSGPDRRCRRWVRRVSLGLMGRRERAHDRRP
ncbi:hypothetical protein B296_00026032 [Ensete ventricosum]|uniref:Uncharacterized protein n=1 Tax=Ensete ventricosum TaxID=4639 RepID=A0A426XGJ9_ENSVE|nr:hypothetical protein B296_00026032 [Ensete ventricosum]